MQQNDFYLFNWQHVVTSLPSSVTTRCSPSRDVVVCVWNRWVRAFSMHLSSRCKSLSHKALIQTFALCFLPVLPFASSVVTADSWFCAKSNLKNGCKYYRIVPRERQHEVKATLEADNLSTMSVLQLFPPGWKPLPFWQMPSVVSGFGFQICPILSCPTLDRFLFCSSTILGNSAATGGFSFFDTANAEEEGWQLQLVA